MKRRKFLVTCLGFLGGIFSVGVLYPVLRYLQPPPKSKKGEVVKILKADLPVGGMKQFHLGETPAIAINSQGHYAAFSLICSHLGCLVKWKGEKNEFVCPCHGAIFSADGKVVSGPPPRGLEPLMVIEQEEEIWVS